MKKEQQEVSKTATAITATIMVGLFIGFVALLFSTCSGPTKSIHDLDDFDFKWSAQEFVKRNLRSPSTADFPYGSSNVFKNGKHKAFVRGYVDSQNGFGGIVRSNWSINITYDSTTTTYTYKNLKIQ
tara:strand:- start:4 stop:384 length:381 start_codon:yes stop_codon:yes gene_type:complete